MPGASVYGVAVQANGKIVTGGTFSTVGGQSKVNLARLDAVGTLEDAAAFNSGGDPNSALRAIAIQPNGMIVIGGFFTSVGGVNRNRVARLNSDGTVQDQVGFNSGTGVDDGYVSCLAVQPDGRILVAGSFTSFNGQARNGIARLNSDGSLENVASFDIGSGANGEITSVALQQDGKILICGDFTSFAGQSCGRIARLLPNGTLDASTFNPGSGFDAKVTGIVQRADGRIICCGAFTTCNGATANRIALLGLNGTVESTSVFNPGTGANSTIWTMAIQSDGRVMIGGSFTTFNDTSRTGFARLNSDGSLDNSLNPVLANPSGQTMVQGIAQQDDGRILLSGRFTTVNGIARNRLVRLANDIGNENLSVSQGLHINWLRSGALPELRWTAFEASYDNGATWSFIGNGTRISGGWECMASSFPGTGLVRIRGCTASGYYVGSSGGIERILSLSAGNPLPEIAVEGPTSTDLANGAIQPISGLIVGMSKVVEFTVRNRGYGELSGLAVTVTGSDASLFQVTRQPTSSIGNFGGATTFEIRFSASNLGSKSATLHIASNDSDESPFAINLEANVAGIADSNATSFQRLTSGEYFIGSDPGEGSGTPLPLTGANGLACDLSEVAIPVDNLPAGTHEVSVRVRDEAGRWSNPSIRRFTVSSFTVAGGVDPSNPNAGNLFPKTYQPLTQAEYFVGADPGEGNGTPLALTGSAGMARDLADVTIPVGSLPAGTHEVKMRVRDEAGRWSNPLIRRFTVSSFTVAGGVDPSNPNAGNLFPKTYLPLAQAEWFVGADPGEGNGTPLSLTGSDGLARDVSSVAIPLNMSPGSYDVSVRVRDESERWSRPLKRRFNLYSTVVKASQRSGSKLVDLEYDIAYGPRDFTVVVLVSNDGGLTWSVPTGSVTGDVGSNVSPGHSRKIVWHAGEDWNNGFSETMRFRVIAYETAQDTPAGFAPITPGAFTMGSPASELGRSIDEAERDVTMKKPFYLKTNEVTWSEWNAVRNQGAAYGYIDIAAGQNGNNGDASGNHPVTNVSWMDVVKWCNLKSEIEGRKPVYYTDVSLNPATVARAGIPTIHAFWNANGYRLPSEAEWEYACRAGTTTAFSSGAISDVTTDASLGNVGWYAANGGNNTHVAAGKTANSKGLYDMHGNVREWCWDAYGTYAAGPQWDPVTGAVGAFRVLRGGDWNDNAAVCRSAARASSGQNSRGTDIGFRLALNFSGLTDLASPNGIPIDSRDPAAGNLIAGMRPAFNGAVHSTISLPDGKLLVVGSFTMVDGYVRNRIARLNPDASLDTSFNPGADSAVYCAALQSDGKILLGGDFSTVASGPADFFTRLNVDGSLDTSFHPQVDYVVRCLLVQADGKTVIGGEFGLVGGSVRNRLARLLSDGSLDPMFDPNVDGTVRTLALQTDGSILLGGNFSTVAGQPRSRIAKVQASGSLDAGFNPAADGEIDVLAVQANGQILAGGAFGTLGGQARSGLARLSPAGSLDTDFNFPANGPVRSIALQADGRILIGGDFTTMAGSPRHRLAALSSAGNLDSAFALDFSGSIRSLHLLSNGKLVIAGDFASVNGVTRQRMAWLDNDAPTASLTAMSGSRVQWQRGGSSAEASQVNFEISTNNGLSWLPLGVGVRIDGGWERNGVNLASSGLLRATATIPTGTGNASASLISSTSSFSGLVTIPEIVVERSTGGEIADGGAFGFGIVTLGVEKQMVLIVRNIGYGDLTGLTITKDGSYPQDFEVATYPVSPVHGPAESTALGIRFNPGDAGFRSANIHIANNDSNESPFDIALSGNAVIAGQLGDATDPQINGRVNAIAVQPDGKVLVGGAFTSFGNSNPVARGRFARLNSDLSLESTSTFAAGSGANSNVFAIAVQPDKKILVAGQFTTINSQSRPRLARINSDGSLESTATFNIGTGPNNIVQALALQPDGKIVIGGDFTNVGGTANPRSRIARLNANGTLEATTTFNAGTGANGQVSCMALQADGKIVIGGMFTTFNGLPRQRLARLLPDGSLDPDFTPSADAKVSCLAVQPDGRILIGGLFTNINGASCGRIARLLADGTLESLSAFDPGTGADDEVCSIAVQADGSILFSGAFTMVNEEARAGIARLYPNGTLEVSSTFETSFGADQPVRALALREDGGVIAGGEFTDYNGTPRGRLALLANQESLNELRVASHSRIEWELGATSPAVPVVELALSTDGGTNWSVLPTMGRTNNGWAIDGLDLPSAGMIRVRGKAAGGFASASSSLVEKVVSFVNPPALVTLPATSITTESAVLNGTITPNGSAQVRFEYGATPALGSFTSMQTLSGSQPIPVSLSVTGLSGIYYFRINAQTTGGIYYGETLSFVTAPVPPVAVTGNPIFVTTSSYTLIGIVNPRGRETTVHFEYGTTALYGNSTATQIIPAGNDPVEISAPISELAANAAYHYRIVAVNSAGTANGSDVTFVTTSLGIPTAAPSVSTGAATEITTVGAGLAGAVNPNGGFTNAFFEYGTSAALGSVSPNLGAGNGSVPATINWNLTNLQPGTTYSYRLVASNSLGTTQGNPIRTFTTRFLPPVVTAGNVQPVGTTGARVSGTVRARGAEAQVFLDYGTDGVTFPNSVGGAPATVNGDTEIPVTADLTNLQQGVTYYYRLRAENSGGSGFGTAGSFTPAILSGLTRQFPAAPPEANGTVTVNLVPAGIISGWRFAGERQWRASGSTAVGLTTGDRTIEFRPVPGYIQPRDEVVGVVSAAAPFVLNRDYYETGSPGTGAVTVLLKPEDLSAGTVPIAQRAQWRFEGEGDDHWRDSGTTISALASGSYLIECKSVAGRATPSLVEAQVNAGQTTLANITYYLASNPTGIAAVVQPFSAVSSNSAQPHGFVGQIRTSAGLSSGFVVKPRVVATAGHVVFDDGTMQFVENPQWLLQRDRDVFEPKPLVSRGCYVFEGYASQRQVENTPGVSSPQSQNLDVAALFFSEDAARGGGYSGFLASDTTTNEFLNTDSLKILIGYPVDGVAANEQGRMFATPPAAFAFTPGFGRTHSTTAIRGAGGMSGGPLCVRHENGTYYPAAIFLGGSAQTVVRAIDSQVIDMFNRAQVSGDGGDNNTGGGITHSAFSSIGASGDPGALTINIQPAAARNGGAGWRLKPETSYRESGSQKNNLSSGSYILQLKTVEGFAPPAQQTVVINGGQLSQYTFTYATANTVPTISAISNRTINEDGTTGPIGFTIDDNESSASALTVTRSSSNTTLVPAANIVLAGSGANRTVTVTPAANQSGAATITLTVSDGDLTATESFTVTVNPVNDAPSLTAPTNLQLALNASSGNLAVTIGDVETAASSLLLSATSSNTTLIPGSGLTLVGSGSNRSVVITPATGQLGTATITLTVSDGVLTANATFTVQVSGSALEAWRFSHFGNANGSGDAADTADADGDGSTNHDEYAAGTDPNNAADRFRVISSSRVGGTFRVNVAGKAGRGYTLERCVVPAGGPWLPVISQGPLASDGEINLEDTASPADKAFYRVRVTGP